jgi:hypothetical protein
VCVRTAIYEGLKAGGLGVAISSVLVLGASKLSPAFNKSLSISGKTALIITPMVGLFFLETELEMNRCAQRRRAFQIAQQGQLH